MKIIKIEEIRKQRRTVYDIEEKDLMKFGSVFTIKEKLKFEDGSLIEFLEEEEDFFEVEEETGDEICDTQWFHEDDEI